MNERFTKVFDLQRNLYAENSPVIISAGALLKDNIKNIIVAQLKFKNISDKVIKAVKVSILPKDVTGNEIDTAIDFEYLDLNVKRDEEFGQKVPVVLKNKTTRSFSVIVKEIVFEDGSIQNIECDWFPLTESKLLDEFLEYDIELVKEYKTLYGSSCKFMPIEDRNLWICTCGGINKSNEDKCLKCKLEYQELKNVSIDNLKLSRKTRLEKEKIIREQHEALAKEDKQKAMKAAAVIVPVIILLSIITSTVKDYKAKVNQYNYAINMISAESTNIETFDSAVEIFESLDGFKKSEEQIIEIKYRKANKYIEYENFNAAISLFEELGDYKDSVEKLEQVTISQKQRELINQVKKILLECSGNYGSRSDETSSYYGFKKAMNLIKTFDEKKNMEILKLYNDISLALEYYGKWKIESGKLKALGISSFYSSSVKKIAFNLIYSESGGVQIKSLPVMKGSEDKDGSFSYYSYYTENFKISSEKKYKFECEGINYDSDSVSYIPAIKDNQFKIKLFEDGKYTANIVLSR